MLRARRWASVAAALIVLAACGDDDEGASGGPPLTVESANGLAVDVAAVPERVVSLSPSASEVLVALGAGEAIVAVDPVTGERLDLPGDDELVAFPPAPATIDRLAPDLLLADSLPPGLEEALTDAIPAVLSLPIAADVDGVEDNLRLVGRLVDRADAADRLVDDFRDRLDGLRGRIDGEPVVHVELDAAGFTLTDAHLLGRLLETVGFRLASEASPLEDPVIQVSEDVIREADPALVLIAHDDPPVLDDLPSVDVDIALVDLWSPSVLDVVAQAVDAVSG